MKKIAFTLAAMTVLTVAFASETQASSRTSHGSSYNHNYVSTNRYANYHLNYGTRFSHGYYYTGRYHSHWTYTRYDARYGCTCYYDPCCSTWYYWCQQASCYYPVSYCPYGYCATGTCSSHRTPLVNVQPFGQPINGQPINGQGPITSGGPVAPVAPVGPAGPTGPVGPGPNGPNVVAPQTNDAPPIPSPVSAPR